LKKITILDAVYEVSGALNMVKLVTIRKSCRKICPDVEEEDCFGFKKGEFSALKLSTILKDTPGFVNADSDRILEWF